MILLFKTSLSPEGIFVSILLYVIINTENLQKIKSCIITHPIYYGLNMGFYFKITLLLKGIVLIK